MSHNIAKVGSALRTERWMRAARVARMREERQCRQDECVVPQCRGVGVLEIRRY